MNPIDFLQPFGESDCESDLMILGEKRYKDYYFSSTHFTQQSLSPFVYLVVGRRGSGKTALTKFFSFQDVIPGALIVDIDEPAVFHEVLSKVAEQGSLNRELQIPRLVKIWEYVIWSSIFYKLRNKDFRISAACTFSGEEGLSKIIRSILQALMSKYVGTDNELIDELDLIFRSKTFKEAQRAVLNISSKNPIIISMDTLEKYSINDEMLMIAVAALVECASIFCREYTPRKIYIKVFLMDEVFSYLTEEYISNPLKYIKNEVYLHWRPKVLMQMICWRLFKYMQLQHMEPPNFHTVDWSDHCDVREKVWYRYFGRYLEGVGDSHEKVFPYILRHTHLRPRQLIILCNAIAERAITSQEFPYFSSDHITAGVQQAAEALANEVFNAYSCIYPNAAKIVDALSGISPIFLAKELDKRAHQTASQWLEHYSPYQFRQLVTELGIVGRVRKKDDASGIVEADFEYFKKGRIVLSNDDLCVIHPMFYTRLNIALKEKLYVYPFPDHEEFISLRYLRRAA